MFGFPLYLELCISRSASSLGTQVIGHNFFSSRGSYLSKCKIEFVVFVYVQKTIHVHL